MKSYPNKVEKRMNMIIYFHSQGKRHVLYIIHLKLGAYPKEYKGVRKCINCIHLLTFYFVLNIEKTLMYS